jgi:hypothetical protein
MRRFLLRLWMFAGRERDEQELSREIAAHLARRRATRISPLVAIRYE